MNLEDRQEQINALIPALESPALLRYLAEEFTSQMTMLLNNNDEQTRGRIKALRDLINLPESLKAEREGIAAALSGSPDAA